MADSGWIKLHRSIMDSGVYSDNLRFKAWVDLILRANHEDKEWFDRGRLVKVKKGQCVTSIRKLSDAWGCDVKTTRKILDQFVEMGMIEHSARTGRYTVITLVKYGFYQSNGSHKSHTDSHTDSTADSHTDSPIDSHTDSHTDSHIDSPQTITTRTTKNDTRTIQENKKPASRIGFYDAELED